MTDEQQILCACSAYEQKFYFNNKYASIPEVIKQELQIMCVMFGEDVGGEIILEFSKDGHLYINVRADEGDLLYDEIGSGLKVKQLQRDKEELFEQLEAYYRSFIINNVEQ